MIRVRFAPSPTGYLHIGNLRGVLFNMLFAKKHKGTFILRMEDTDLVRSSKNYEKQIIDDLEWLGIYFDEGPHLPFSKYGPYRQSERLDIYKKYADILLDKGYVEKILDEQDSSKYALKLNIGKQKIQIKDRIFNLVEREVEDFIIMKSNGYPTYHFACVVDDYLMGISHIIRGQDHLVNTAKHILLYNLFGWSSPEYAHYSLTLNLSKRNQSQSLLYFREKGYAKEAIINKAMLLGWSPKDQNEKFNIFDKIEEFSIKDLSKVNSKFDQEKLNWLANKYLKDYSLEELYNQVIKRLYINYGKNLPYDKHAIEQMINLYKDQIRYIEEFVELTRYLFQESLDYKKNMDSLKKNIFLKEIKIYVTLLLNTMKNEEIYTNINKYKDFIKECRKKKGIEAKKLFVSLRYVLTADINGPEIYNIFSILGYKRVESRIQQFIRFLNDINEVS